MMTILIVLGSLIPVLPLLRNQNFAATSGNALLLGLLAGIINGVGLLAWYRLVAGSNEGLWELSRVLPIGIVLLAVVIVIGGRIFFNEPLTTDKLTGLALACAAIWLLS
jgi:predicted RND superfamily exporter protein